MLIKHVEPFVSSDVGHLLSNFQHKILRLTTADIAHLKEKAKSTTNTNSTTNQGSHHVITSFNVVTALIWWCEALSSSSPSCDSTCDGTSDRESTILYVVDIRARLKPPLPEGYTGNAVLPAYASAPLRELKEGPISKMVEMVHEGATRMTDEFARSFIDLLELHKGFAHGEALVSSWWRLGFADVEYPWGKPMYSCPVVCDQTRKDTILLFPPPHQLPHYSSTMVAASLAPVLTFWCVFLLRKCKSSKHSSTTSY